MQRLAAIIVATFLLATCTFAQSTSAAGAAPTYDLLITHARIVDGSGNPWYRGDIAV